MSVLKSAAAAASLAVLAAAGPAVASITMTFDVDVNSATGVSGFAPFSFQETWTFDASYTSSGSAPFIQQDFIGPASVTDSPVTAALKAGVGVTGAAPTANHEDFSNFQAPGFSAASEEFFWSVTQNTLESAEPFPPLDVYDSVSYRRDLSNNSPGFYLPASMDGPGLLAYVTAFPTFDWSESASHQVGGIFFGDPAPTVLFDEEYDGTATFVSATGIAAPTPEPASWALMIVGVAGLGAALRRRKGIAAA